MERKNVVSIKKTVVPNTDGIEQHKITLNPTQYCTFISNASSLEKKIAPRTYDDAQTALTFLSKYKIVPDISIVEGRIKLMVQYCWNNDIKSYRDTIECLKKKNLKAISPRIYVATAAALLQVNRAIFKDPRTLTACQNFLTAMTKKPIKVEEIGDTPIEKERERAYQVIDKKINDFSYVKAFIEVTQQFNHLYADYLNLNIEAWDNVRCLLKYWEMEKRVMGTKDTKEYFEKEGGIKNIEKSILYGRVSLIRAAMYCKGKSFQHALGRETAKERYERLITEGFLLHQQNIVTKRAKRETTPYITESHVEQPTESAPTISGLLFDGIPTSLSDVDYLIQALERLPSQVLPVKLKKRIKKERSKMKLEALLDSWKQDGKYHFPKIHGCKIITDHFILSAVKYILLKKAGEANIVFPTKVTRTTTMHRLEKVEKQVAKFLGVKNIPRGKGSRGKNKTEAHSNIGADHSFLSRFVVLDQVGSVLHSTDDVQELNVFIDTESKKQTSRVYKVYRECTLVKKTVVEIKDS